MGLLYTAEHAALALVEILVHMPQVPYADLPSFRLFTLELPDDSIRVLRVEQLPPHWQDDNYSHSQTILADWLAQPDVVALGVPSSVMPDSINYLLHSDHPAYASIRVVEEKALLIDPRLWSR